MASFALRASPINTKVLNLEFIECWSPSRVHILPIPFEVNKAQLMNASYIPFASAIFYRWMKKHILIDHPHMNQNTFGNKSSCDEQQHDHQGPGPIDWNWLTGNSKVLTCPQPCKNELVCQNNTVMQTAPPLSPHSLPPSTWCTCRCQHAHDEAYTSDSWWALQHVHFGEMKTSRANWQYWNPGGIPLS